MLIAGSLALLRSRRLEGTRNVTGERDDPPAPMALVRAHKRAGRAALVAAALGLITAGIVLAGMYSRL
jgi:hypothetical protein